MNELTDSVQSLNVSYFLPSAEKGGEQVFRLLAGGRVDFIPYHRSVALFYLGIMDMREKIADYGCLIKRLPLTVALTNKKNGMAEVSDALDLGMKRLKQNGHYAAILDKYYKNNKVMLSP